MSTSRFKENHNSHQATRTTKTLQCTKLFVEQVLDSANTNQMMVELISKNDDDKEYQEISEDFKNIVKEQGNIEADANVHDPSRNTMTDVLPLLRRVTRFFVKFSARAFNAMSSEVTSGVNSDEFIIFRSFPEFGWPWPHRVPDHSDTDVVLTACTSGADKGNKTVHAHNALIWQIRGIRLLNHFWSKQENPSFNAVRIRRVNPWLLQRGWEACTHDAPVAGFGTRSMYLETWTTGADRWYSRSTDWGRHRRGGQIPSLCETVSGTSTLRKSRCFRHELAWNRPVGPDLCCESAVLVQLFLVWLSWDIPHRPKCAISSLKSYAQVSTSWSRLVDLRWSSIVSQSKHNLRNDGTLGHNCCSCRADVKEQVFKHVLIFSGYTRRKLPNCITECATISRVPRKKAEPAILMLQVLHPEQTNWHRWWSLSGRRTISRQSSVRRYHQRKVKWWAVLRAGLEESHVLLGAGAAGTVATTKHPDLQKSEEERREHFRRQGSKTSTQPQTFQPVARAYSSSSSKDGKGRNNIFPSPRIGRPV